MLNIDFKPYSARPIEKGVVKDTSDCIIRAMATVLPMSYKQAFDLLTANADGSPYRKYRQAHSNVIRTLENLGLEREWLDKGCTVKTFAKETAKTSDAFIVFTRGHAVAVVGGRYLDTWDSGARRIKEFCRVTFDDWKRLTEVFKTYKGGKVKC